MSKIALLFCFLLVPVRDFFAQTCLNPTALLDRLNSPYLTKDSLYQLAKNDMDFIQLKPEDTVADVGSYNGYRPILYSIFSSTAVFYLNDITNEGFFYFDTIQSLCKKISGKSISNKFEIVIGTDSCTNLPGNFFNKVILRDALHHFKYRGQMLQDIKRIMNPVGKLMLFEPLKEKSPDDRQLCHGAMTTEEILKLLNENGFVLTTNKNGRLRKKEMELQNGTYCWFEFKLAKE